MKKMNTELPKSVLTKSQKIKRGITFEEGGVKHILEAEIRFDDECGNSHNTFAITGSLYERTKTGRKMLSCGCIHEEIVKHMPELKKYIKWHGCTTDGPLYYLADTLYHISDKDCWGKKAGEPYNYKTFIQFNDVPTLHELPQKFIKFLRGHDVMDFEVVPVPYVPSKGSDYKFTPKYTFLGYDCKWHNAPFDDEVTALEYQKAFAECRVALVEKPTSFGEGKEKDLDAARNTAIWPEAEMEDFTEEKLLKRLSGLMEEFKADMEELGFIY